VQSVQRESKALRMLRASRLVRAREAAGYTEATEAAKALRVPPPTYLGHENGSRGFGGSASALLYAKKFDVPLGWLLGEDEQTAKGKPDRDELVVIVEKAKRLPDDKLKRVAEFIDFEAARKSK